MDIAGYRVVGDDEAIDVAEGLVTIGEALFVLPLVEIA